MEEEAARVFGVVELVDEDEEEKFEELDEDADEKSLCKALFAYLDGYIIIKN